MLTQTTIVILAGLAVLLVIVLSAIATRTPLTATFEWMKGAIVKVGEEEDAASHPSSKR